MIPEGLGHAWGECLIHEPSRTCFLNIPKCASTSMKTALGAIGFVHVREGGWVKPDGWFTFAIIRDPWERLASGVYEVARRRELAGLPPLDLTTAAAEWPVDEHLIAQEEFFHPANPVDRFVEFKRLDKDVPLVLAERGLTVGPIPRENERR